MSWQRAVRALSATLFACSALAGADGSAAELTAREIVERVHDAAGGAAWLAAGSNVMSGHATLCRDGDPRRCAHADRYVMYRVYPTELTYGAHAGSGKFRLDAYRGDEVLFQVAFDGVLSVDIHWTAAEVGTPIPDDRFVLGRGVESGG